MGGVPYHIPACSDSGNVFKTQQSQSHSDHIMGLYSGPDCGRLPMATIRLCGWRDHDQHKMEPKQ